MVKMIFGTLAVLVVLVVVFMLTRGGPFEDETSSQDASGGLESFRDVDFGAKAAKLLISKGSGQPVELAKEGSGWIVASAHGADADPEVVEKILNGLDDIDEGEIAGKSSRSHADFEVDKRKGGFLTVRDAGGAELGRLVIGKTDSRSRNFSKTKVFVRFGDEPVTYSIESDLRSDAKLWSDEVEAKNFVRKKLIDINTVVEGGEEKKVEREIFEVRIQRPGQDDLLAELRREEVPVDEPATPEEDGAAEEGEEAPAEPKTETQDYYVVTVGSETHRIGKDKEWSVRSLLTKGETVRVDDVAEPKPAADYGLDAPQLRVTYKHRAKGTEGGEVGTVTLLFGNAIKDEKGEDKDFYFAIDGAEWAGKAFIVSKFTKEGWDKKLADFLPAPEPEGAGAEGADDADAPDGPSEGGEESASSTDSPSGTNEPVTEGSDGATDGSESAVEQSSEAGSREAGTADEADVSSDAEAGISEGAPPPAGAPSPPPESGAN